MGGGNRKASVYSDLEASPYQTEILALALVTEALKAADPSDTGRLIAVISKNINLWGIFEFAASAPSNKLPLETRKSITRLAGLARYLSLKSVRAPSHLQDLIAINEAILDGLRSQRRNSIHTDTPFSGKIDV